MLKSSIRPTCKRDRCTINGLVVTIGPPGSNDFPALGSRRPHHDHEEVFPVAEADVAPLAVELAHVLALEHRIVEHARRPDEVDAMVP